MTDANNWNLPDYFSVFFKTDDEKSERQKKRGGEYKNVSCL
jgi:hypothetical protein